MDPPPKNPCSLAFLAVGLVAVTVSCSQSPPGLAAKGRVSAPPATQAEAAQVFDLRTFPAFQETEYTKRRKLASLSYVAPGTIKELLEFQRRELVSRGWQQLPGGDEWQNRAERTFSKDGFFLSVEVHESGRSHSSVELVNHGNVPVDALPVPDYARLWLANATVSQFLATSDDDKKIIADCHQLLVAQGWQPYGNESSWQYFKQNAVRLWLSVHEVPRLPGKRVILYKTELMSMDLPPPATWLELRYSDVQPSLWFDTHDTSSSLIDGYSRLLSKSGWTPNGQPKTESDNWTLLNFSNAAGERLKLGVFPVGDINRVLISLEPAPAG